MSDSAKLYLEVAEDYAVVARNAIDLVQVKDTASSSTVTLHARGVRGAITRLVALSEANPSNDIYLRFLTTSRIGKERPSLKPPCEGPGLSYWRRCAAGADVQPVRQVLQGEHYSTVVRDFCLSRDDATLRRDLLQRIHWDCGCPPFVDLRKDLDDRLVRLGRDIFSIPSPDVPAVADSLIWAVLEKSILKDSEKRFLTRSDLYRTIDAVTTVSIPRAMLKDLASFLSAVRADASLDLGDTGGQQASTPHWIIDNASLPRQTGTIPRRKIAAPMDAVLAMHGVCVLTGSSGLGKSTIARSVSLSGGGRSHTVDFRHLSSDEAHLHLGACWERSVDLDTDALIVEDLNVLHDPQVALATGRLFAALCRRDVRVILTCHRRPSQASLQQMGLSAESVVPCGYFSLEESELLVQKYDGDADRWGSVAHSAGSNGHPQLVHAIVHDMAMRGWPQVSTEAPHETASAAPSVEAVWEDARRTIVNLPRGARTLLYRLSLGLVHFSRNTALTIGSLPPELSQAGESFDELVGPWIERMGTDSFRVSPLAGQVGQQMLSGTDEIAVHREFAVNALRAKTLVAQDLNGIFGHVIRSRWEAGLAQLAMSVAMAEGSTSILFAEHFSALRRASLESSIYPESPKAAALLRIAQMKLLAVMTNRPDMTAVVGRMFEEITALIESDLQMALEAFALGNLLAIEGIVNRVDNWVDLLLRAEHAAEHNAMFRLFSAGFQEIAGVDGSSGGTVLWNFGITEVASVERLERIVDDLDRVDERVRSVWLIPLDESFADYSVWINGPWSTEEKSGVLNPSDAAARYRRMASKTRSWNTLTLSLQCFVAEAVLLDEYLEQKDAAFSVLVKAEEIARGHPVILRARAGIHYRHREYGEALGVFRRVANRIDERNPVEQAFALREAAISAAQCEEWTEAGEWFQQAQDAARRAENPDTRVMAAAMEADLAAVALLSGDVSTALTKFARALEESQTISEQNGLVSAYYQRVVRHAVLWCFNKVEGREHKPLGGKPIVFEPGMCSNPTPTKEILAHPLGPIDPAWYMLAHAEATSGANVGIQERLEVVLQAGAIPALAVGIRWRRMRRHIGRLDSEAFAKDLLFFLEGENYLVEHRDRIATWDPMKPERGEIPSLDFRAVETERLEAPARNAIVAFAMCAVCRRQVEAIDSLQRALVGTYGERVPGGDVLDEFRSGRSKRPGLGQAIVGTIEAVRRGQEMEPEVFWRSCFSFLCWSLDSPFERVITEGLACWLRREWTRIVEHEEFRLANPGVTVSRIKEELKLGRNDREFVVRVLLTTLDAVGGPAKTSYRSQLNEILRQ